MRIALRNISDNVIILRTDKGEIILNPNGEAAFDSEDRSFVFEAEIKPVDLSEDIEDKEGEGLKERILNKLAKTAAGKISELSVCTTVSYEYEGQAENEEIVFDNGVYFNCYGKISDLFDMLPVAFSFPEAECSYGKIRALNAKHTNRKTFLKAFRRIILFVDWGLILPDLFLFIPKYLLAGYFTSNAYISHTIVSLYKMTPEERIGILRRVEERIEKGSEDSGCLISILKGLLVLLIIAAFFVWANYEEIKTMF